MERADRRSNSNRNIERRGYKVTGQGAGGRWYVNDQGRVFGPMPWAEIKRLADRSQITPFAQIWEESWPQWMPIGYYLQVKMPGDREVEALIPSRYDAMFYSGMALFIVGIFIFFAVPILGIIFFIFSPIIEFLALYLEIKHKGMTVAGSIGNALAMLWIIIQIVVTTFILRTPF
jgi:hypothetical protein